MEKGDPLAEEANIRAYTAYHLTVTTQVVIWQGRELVGISNRKLRSKIEN